MKANKVLLVAETPNMGIRVVHKHERDL